ncbi:MAG: hypothetical protein FWG64_03015 [Firmicutes bacterium]|nr:hypothetical protein [Bacillota bacterium]
MTNRTDIYEKYTKRKPLEHFLMGMARAIDIGGAYSIHTENKNGYAADREALRGDWERVGNDLKSAMARYDNAE